MTDDATLGSLEDDQPQTWDLPSSLFSAARVMIVDDVPSNVQMLEQVLRSAGVTEILTLTDPRRVIDSCRSWAPDVVLLDWHMPHTDGHTILRTLRSTLPEDSFLPVLVLTADTSSQAKQDALHAGASDFLTKPFDFAEVVLRVRNHLETRMLHVRVQHHKLALQVRLDRSLAEQRRIEERHRVRTARIERVLANDDLHVVFQPVFALGTMDVIGVEALARFESEPIRPPNEWFAEAAEVGLGAQLELRAIDRALACFDRLKPNMFISLNVSPETASSDELPRRFTPAHHGRVILELTERVKVDDYDVLWQALLGLRNRGVRNAIDDAGGGYAGLQHILRLRPDVVKLDLDLTRNVNVDPARRALVSAMVSFCREISATLVAEGIEKAHSLDTLRALGVAWGQGYHLGRPGPLSPEWCNPQQAR